MEPLHALANWYLKNVLPVLQKLVTSQAFIRYRVIKISDVRILFVISLVSRTNLQICSTRFISSPQLLSTQSDNPKIETLKRLHLHIYIYILEGGYLVKE
ncbi:hypothetical protein CIPAW_08G097100 [Carya illinoinensis]|uniref:Uncharacterized protein n=1 Tax=Carya illinoinensis TaxID=32201 RepID=A0A8T1PKV5_CARIL|nr:hypothetical protein CIPAW_08G097100 [Carya illinoinensis]